MYVLSWSLVQLQDWSLSEQVDCAHLKGNALTVPADVYKAGCVTDAQQALASASRIGYPVMIKVRILVVQADQSDGQAGQQD